MCNYLARSIKFFIYLDRIGTGLKNICEQYINGVSGRSELKAGVKFLSPAAVCQRAITTQKYCNY